MRLFGKDLNLYKDNDHYYNKIIIKRNEAEIIDSIDKWILVYDRRKTGKLFSKNFVKQDKYFFVKTGKTIINEYEK